MEKLLSISIAAYNAEKYIRTTLNSILKIRDIEKLEVFIVDDGGTDNTFSIASEYASKYPDVFIPVHKENGGYGSTVNYSIQKAKGQFFRLLDGDDWLCVDYINQYLEILKDSCCEFDILVTDVNNYFDSTGTIAKRIPSWNALENGIYRLTDKKMKYLFSMWQLTVRTDNLRKVWKNLPEHTLYTDQLFVYYALLSSNMIRIEHIPTYCYRIGREGQSIEASSRKKHYKDLCCVFDCMINDYVNRENIKNSIESRIETLYAQIIATFLMFKREKKWYLKIKEYENNLKVKSRNIYKNMWWAYKKVTVLRIFRYIAYMLLSNGDSFY